MYTRGEKIEPRYIEEEIKDSYITYAMSVIVGRALPDARDGLKPVHRRILYAMDELSSQHNKPYKKSARITGEVLGKYHPHGDMAVYDALVRMVQDFSLRYPLVDGQGNFGCFTKNTKVKLADGRSISFGELVQEEKEGRINYTYTYNIKKHRVEIAPIEFPRLTKKKVELVEVKLDNGEGIKCTPNHQFMLRDGTYREARDLKPGDSLMPLYMRFSTADDDSDITGYQMVYQPFTDKWEYVHRLADQWNILNGVYPKSAGKIKHHLDFNKLNNNPDNIRRFPWGAHWQVHYKLTAERHKNDPQYVQRLAEGRRKYWNSKGVKQKYSRLFKELNKRNWKDPKYREKMIRAVKKKWEDPQYKRYMAKLSSVQLKKLWKRPGFSQWRGKLKSEELKTKWKNKDYAAHMAEVTRRHSYKMWQDPAHREHISRLSRERWLDPEYKKKMSEKSKRQWQNSAYKEYMVACYRKKWQEDPEFRKIFIPILTRNGKRAHYYRFLKVCERVIAKHKTINAENYEKERLNYGTRGGEGIVKHEKALRKYFNGDISGAYRALKERGVISKETAMVSGVGLNHRVISVKKLKKREDVYDLTIKDTHNFVLAAGIFVHNSVDGDSAAAMRYTEARMEAISDEMLKDIDKDTVDFVPNFDDTLQEPTVLPAVVPNLLVNGSSGIAVGMATNMPSHNLGEVVDGTIKVIDNPDVSIKDLMKIIKGPDFPTGALICGREGIKRAYTTGRGLLKLHARANIETQKGSKESIIITELPYQVNKANLIAAIADLVTQKKIEGISDIRDESDKEGIRVVIDIKRDQPAQVILNQLYKHTQLGTTFGVIMLALVGMQPRVLNLRQLIDVYIDHRKEVVIRRTRYELAKAQERAHILEGLKIALKHIDKIIKTIKASKSTPEAKQALVKNFDLTERQAQAILEMQLQRLTALERSKIEQEYLELIKKIEYYQSILHSGEKVFGIIKEELTEIKKKYADERRTEIVGDVEELAIEDLIAEEDVVITISHTGYIKRLPVSSYRRQHRGGKGVTGAALREEDFIEHLFIASTHECILFFTDKGKAYWLKVHEIPQAGRISKGKAIINLLQLGKEENVTAFVPVRNFDEKAFLIMATQKGLIKRVELSAFSNPRKAGIMAMGLGKDDALIRVTLTDGNQEVVLASREGKALRFKEKDVRVMGRAAKGVKGMSLGKKDIVIAMGIAKKEATLLTITEKGFGKRTQLEDYRTQHRGGKGIINIKISKRNGPVVGIKTLTDKDEIMVMTHSGMIVRTYAKDIRTTGRSTQGVRLISLKDKDMVSSVASVVTEQE